MASKTKDKPRKTSSAAKKVYRGERDDKIVAGIRIPKVRLTSLGTSTISLPSPPRMLFLMGTYIFLAWLMAGGIFFIVREPPALGESGGNPLYFWPSLNESFLIEGFIASILLFVAGFGMVMLYQASLQAYNRANAIRYLVIGLTLGVLSFGLLQYIIMVKLGIF
ncbi:hypothetical protein GF325_18000 [Candidatus Bathyarchaeota archaeon]|nr:hypothetical protein [Candidatus Bathyarchaeota archaeon]